MALKALWGFLILFFLSAHSCDKETAAPSETQQSGQETVSNQLFKGEIPEVWDIQQNIASSLPVEGYSTGDQLLLQSSSGGKEIISLPIIDGQVTFPDDLATYNYRISILRGDVSYALGHTTFNYVLRADIPNLEGKNIKGVVHVDGKGIPDVLVSDGYEVALTDAEGVYYLKSTKKTGYVFVSIPGNHEMVESDGNLPLFYQNVQSNPGIIDTRDFALREVSNEEHVLLSLADMHLANRNNDLSQFQNGFMQDVNAQIAKLRGQGKRVYALTLGDQTWETYWYSNSFMLPDYVKEIAKLNAPVFNTVGNHDNDPYFANDWLAENMYRRILGPTYYSFNLGKIHYIVLDNVEYINNGGAYGVVGDRSYNAKISEDQLVWLAKDLEQLPASTPIVLATHIPLHQAPSADKNMPNFRTSNAQQLIGLLDRFDQVHVLTGHTHVNYRVPRKERLMEHNLAAICATWWWTGRPGYSDNHIAPDGSPGGYGIWKMQGKDICWQYKSISYDSDYQFRSYDLNTVHITAEKYAPKANAAHKALVPQYAFDFARANTNNEVLINVWGYDPNWSISVTENGRQLPVSQVSSRDPLHIISYGMKRLDVNAIPTFDAANTSHMFKVMTSSPTSTLYIEVTDRFGNVYTENMQRPKAFNYSMR